MSEKKLTRRSFLRLTAVTAAGLAAASCAQPTPEVIEKEVVVEKVVKETVVTEKEVAIEKVVTATPVISQYNEAPSLAGKVKAGELPPVDERLPEEPLVIEPFEEIGQYGGTWHRLAVGPNDTQFNARMTCESFIRFNEFGSEVKPNICTSWEMSPDGSQVTIKLRKGMKWSDGEPLTVDDYAYYFEDHLGNADLSPSTPKWLKPHGDLTTLEKVDDYTIKLDFHGPYGMFVLMEAGTMGIGLQRWPKHYLQQFHPNYTDQAKIQQMAEDDGFEEWYQLYGSKNDDITNPDKPVLYAWQIVQPAPKQPIAAERNAYYWKVDPQGNQLPYIDRIEWMVVQGADQINLRAASGEMDMQLRHITFDNYPIFKENEENGDYRVLEWLAGDLETVVAFTQDSVDPVKKELLEDKRFRFALSLAVNRAEICEAVYYGTVEPSQIVPYPTSPWWTEERANFMADYDPDRANAYLDEMGLTERDAEGYRLGPDGKRLAITWDYAPIFGAWGPIGELITAYYQEIGVELLLREAARQLYYERFRARETDLALWTGHGSFYPILSPRNYAAISYGGSKWAAQYSRWYETGGGDGIEPPADSDIRKSQMLYDEILAAPSVAAAEAKFDELLDLFYDNLWTMAFTTASVQPVIVKNNFRNVPEDAFSSWYLLTPGTTMTEQYFFKQ